MFEHGFERSASPRIGDKVEGRTLVFFLTGGTRFRLEVVIDHLGGVGVSLVELVLWHVHVVESGLGDSRAGH